MKNGLLFVAGFILAATVSVVWPKIPLWLNHNLHCSNPDIITNCTDSVFKYSSNHRIPLSNASDAIYLTGQFFGMGDNLIKSQTDPKLKTMHDYFWSYIPHAWQIPRRDMQNLVDAVHEGDTTSGARVYMAINCGKLHLLMTPTYRVDGSSNLAKNEDFFLKDESGSEYVLDFINPCPRFCADPSLSPLEKSFEDGKADPFDVQELMDTPCKVCAPPSRPNHK